MTWQLSVNGKVVAEWGGDLAYNDPKFPEAASRYAVMPSEDYALARQWGERPWGCAGKCVLREVNKTA